MSIANQVENQKTSVFDVQKANKMSSSQFMHKLYAVVEYQGAPFLAKITVEEYEVNKKRAYNAQRIKMSALSRAQYTQLKTAYRGIYASNADAISVSDLFNLVKTYGIKRKSTQSRAAASPIKAGDRLNASTNNYTQKNGNVNSILKEVRGIYRRKTKKEQPG